MERSKIDVILYKFCFSQLTFSGYKDLQIEEQSPRFLKLVKNYFSLFPI